MPPAHVFLSHAGAETDLARELAHALEQAGIPVWLDVQKLKGDREWILEIEDALRDAWGFVVLVDRLPIRRWVTQEVHVALRRDVEDAAFSIVPVLGPNAVGQALQDSFLGNKQDVRYATHGSWSALAAEVRTRLDRKDDGPRYRLPAGASPFRELAAFGPEDGLLFHGRERETARLLDLLRRRDLVAVIGNSGSGKSSLVKAGLVPALHRGRFQHAGSDVQRWRVVIVRPEARPFENLVAAFCDERAQQGGTPLQVSELREVLRRSSSSARPLADMVGDATKPGEHVLLVVDQLEELIQQSPRPEAERFVAGLLDARGGCHDRFLKVVLTLRADYVSNILDLGFGALSDEVASGVEFLKLPDRGALAQAIDVPMTLTEVELEAAVRERLLDDVGATAGSLALVQFTLSQLWNARKGDRIGLDVYDAIGKLSGALDRHATRVHDDLAPELRPWVRRLMVKLTQPDESGRHTRRAVPRAELLGQDGEDGPAARVLQELVDKRLVVACGDTSWSAAARTYEVPHEELLRSWKLLHGWLEQDGADELVGRRLREFQREWSEHGEGADYVLQAARLSEALAWAERRPEDLDPDLRRFLDESRRVHETAAERERDLGRRVEGLQDLERLRGLQREADDLWPPHPERIPDYERWEREALALVARRPDHERSLEELRALETRNEWLEGAYEELLHQGERVESGLLGEADPEHGVGVPRRLAFARAVEERSTSGVEARRRWEELLADFRNPERFPAPYRDPRNLTLTGLRPMAGLLPWRRDPRSGLWELVHLWSGELPEVGPNGEFVQTAATGIVLVLIPGGRFLMGGQANDPNAPGYDPHAEPDEGPPHEVECPPFLIGKTTITQAQWVRMFGSNPSQLRADNYGGARVGETNPVECVSWEDGMRWLPRFGLRLPTEAQWERAARAGTRTPWWTGPEREDLEGKVNLADQAAKRAGQTWPEIEDWPELDDGFPFHAPAAALEPNPFGLHQVHGNVWEWCEDSKAGGYQRAQGVHPDAHVDPSGPNRVLRGGGFAGSARLARSGYRFGSRPSTRYPSLGFRPAQVIP